MRERGDRWRSELSQTWQADLAGVAAVAVKDSELRRETNIGRLVGGHGVGGGGGGGS